MNSTAKNAEIAKGMHWFFLLLGVLGGSIRKKLKLAHVKDPDGKKPEHVSKATTRNGEEEKGRGQAEAQAGVEKRGRQSTFLFFAEQR
jgi:hypothetical protein